MNQNLRKRQIITYFVNILIPLWTIFSLWFATEIGDGFSSKSAIIHMNPSFILLNVSTLLIVYFILIIIFQKIHIANNVFTILFTIISIANYYTVLLHGSPLTVMELANAKTAANVLGMYTIEIDRYVVFIVILMITSILGSFLLKKFQFSLSWKKIVVRDVLFIIIGICLFYQGYISDHSVKPHKTLTWSWRESFQTYGYVSCSVETMLQMLNVVNEPEGYSDDAFLSQAEAFKNSQTDFNSNATPDIILILNESFYDLNYTFPLETDIDYLENIRSISGIYEGHAVVPLIGGGTNVSEYELLTSNSSTLFPGVTPFNVFSMKEANTISSHLQNLGYTTIGAHNAAAINYNRNTAYPNIGFDQIYFREDFQNIEYYEKRDIMTDSSAFKNVIEWYKANKSSGPFFTYLLTIQNHGGWDTNTPEDAIVHVTNDIGGNPNMLNEYLSCIHLTDVAFKELTDYFSTVDRPVIICMVGDHSPCFITELNSDLSQNEQDLFFRSVPYFVWTNFDADYSCLNPTTSINYIVPSILELGGMQQSTYYSYMNQLRKTVPILSDYNIYIDSNGTQHYYSEKNNYLNSIQLYFYFEYNNLSNNRKQKYFT